jgi:CheY-like chemotaxis protein
MNKRGPIVIVEDDLDDQMLLSEIFTDLKLQNEIVILSNGLQAYEYLDQTNVDPFIIISDINMPLMNGMELRDKMQKEGQMRLRTIPFIFLTTAAAKDTIINAYAHSVQGFFTKTSSINHFRTTLGRIVDYWKECCEPSFHD